MDQSRGSVRGVQYLSIRYTERLAETAAVNSVGSKGDSYDNALAETMNGLYKAELVRNRGPWRGLDDLEFATLEWVDWFNNRRLFEAHGHIPPAEYEAELLPLSRKLRPGQQDSNQTACMKPGAVHGLLRPGRRDPVSVYRFIAAEKASHSIAIMCRVLEVSRSGLSRLDATATGPARARGRAADRADPGAPPQAPWRVRVAADLV